MTALSWKLIELMLMAVANSVIIAGWYKICYYELDEQKHAGYSLCKTQEAILQDSKMILWRVRKFFSRFVSEWYMKPLFTCVICMASVHGTWFYWLCEPFTVESLKWWIPYLIGLAGYNYVYISTKI